LRIASKVVARDCIAVDDKMTFRATTTTPAPSATRPSGLLMGLTALNVIGFILYGMAWFFAAAAVGGQPQAGWQDIVLDVLVALIGASFFAPICAWTIRPFHPIAALVVATVPAMPVILFLAFQALTFVALPVFMVMHPPVRAGLAPPAPPAAIYRPPALAPAGPASDGLDGRRLPGICSPIGQRIPQAVLQTEARAKAHLCGQPGGVGNNTHRLVGAVR